MLAAGPGWVIIGAAKQLGGAFLAFVALEAVGKTHALEPIAPQIEALKPWLGSVALPAAALFVIVSQIKINVTNAYSGSLSWSNFFSRITHRHPGRVWYIFLNLAIALTLMEMNMFAALDKLLGLLLERRHRLDRGRRRRPRHQQAARARAPSTSSSSGRICTP